MVVASAMGTRAEAEAMTADAVENGVLQLGAGSELSHFVGEAGGFRNHVGNW